MGKQMGQVGRFRMQAMNPCLHCLTLLFILVLAWNPACLAQQERIGAMQRLEAWPQHQQMADQSPYRDLEWEPIGPKFAGGRIESIDAPAGDLSTIYVAPGAGGIWKTVNGGLAWRQIFGNESTFAVGDLTIAPSNPDTIWVGTGECHLSRTSYSGNGVFKSTDAGESWNNVGLHETAHIGQIAIDPNDEDIVYVAAMGRKGRCANRGIYKTTDGGKSFRKVLFQGEGVAFVDLVIDPNDSSRLFATGWDRSRGAGSGVYRSEDQGETWKKLGGGLLDQKVDRVAVCVAKSSPGVVYALMADGGSPDLARRRNASILYRSNNYGETWKRTSEDYVPTYVGWDFCDVRVAPDNADLVYVGGFRLMISRDGGKTFTGKKDMSPNRDRHSVIRLHPHRGIGLHLDVHDLWIDPIHPERVLLGNDGGLFVSWDRGDSWLHLNNLPVAEFYRIHLDNRTPFRIWGGTQDNASFVGPATERYRAGFDEKWQHVFLDPWTGGDGFATFPDPHDRETTYYAQQNGDLKRSRLGRLNADKRIRPDQRSLDGGEANVDLSFAWDTPFMASSHGEHTVLYCAAQRVMRSTDRGNSWESISPDFGSSALLALAESPMDANRLIAGGGVRGKVFLTHTGGGTDKESWVEAGPGLPAKVMRDIAASAFDPNRVYVALSGKLDHDSATYLFVTNDFGKTWQSIAGNLPHESVNAVIEDPDDEDRLFVGTDLGVYVSGDRGNSWHSLCHTLPTAPVVDLALHDRSSKLVAATHGMSLFLLDVESIRDPGVATDESRGNR